MRSTAPCLTVAAMLWAGLPLQPALADAQSIPLSVTTCPMEKIGKPRMEELASGLAFAENGISDSAMEPIAIAVGAAAASCSGELGWNEIERDQSAQFAISTIALVGFRGMMEADGQDVRAISMLITQADTAKLHELVDFPENSPLIVEAFEMVTKERGFVTQSAARRLGGFLMASAIVQLISRQLVVEP
jgi:hypothetical protein